MLEMVSKWAIGLSIASFVVFCVYCAVDMIVKLRPKSEKRVSAAAGRPDDMVKQAISAKDIGEAGKALAEGTGGLAKAIKEAGPAPGAAALSFSFLLVALIAAGLELVPHDGKDGEPAKALGEQEKRITDKIAALESKIEMRIDNWEKTTTSLEQKIVSTNSRIDNLTQLINNTTSIAALLKAIVSTGEGGSSIFGPITISLGGNGSKADGVACAASACCCSPVQTTASCPTGERPERRAAKRCR